jgi:hypothetical protein
MKKKVVIFLIGCILILYSTVLYNPINIFKVEMFFYHVEKVELYSYVDRNLWNETFNRDDLKELTYLENNKINIDTKNLKNKISLSKNEISKIKNSLFRKNLSLPYKCYNPRHSIIFYDKNDIVIGYIEICFECSQVKCSKNLNFIAKNALNLETNFKTFGITYFNE